MKSNTNQPIIGIDIGGVIIDRVDDNADTSFFGPNYLMTPAVPGAFEAIRELHKAGFQIYLVSKCGDNVQRKTREWLEHNRFYQQTGVRPADVRFCKTRPEKEGICTQLGVTHFVDDRLEILSYLTGVSHLYLFNANDSEVRKFAQWLPKVTRVDVWSELARIAKATINCCPSGT